MITSIAAVVYLGVTLVSGLLGNVPILGGRNASDLAGCLGVSSDPGQKHFAGIAKDNDCLNMPDWLDRARSGLNGCCRFAEQME